MKTDTPRKRTRRVVAALAAAVAACACLAAYGPPVSPRAGAQDADPILIPTQQKEEEPRCAVYGRVTQDETNRPVRRARVSLVTVGGSRTDLSGVTDSRGDFRIRNVPAGTYYIFVDAPGVLTPASFLSVYEAQAGAFDASAPRKFFEPVEVNGREDKEVTVRARRGAAVSGVVRYADGDPAVGARIHVLRNAGGILEAVSVGVARAFFNSMRTDDRGAYRVSGLPPGEYVVAVTESVEHGDAGNSPARDYLVSSGMFSGLVDRQLLMTYHPSATSRKEAAALKLDIGDERTDVDVTIPDRATHSVEGVVRGRRDKRPVPRARVSIVRRGEEVGGGADYFSAVGEMLQNTVRADEQGRWRLKEIPDGEYRISVTPLAEYEETEYRPAVNGNVSGGVTNMNGGLVALARPRKRYAPASREVSVSGSDLADVTIELNEGASIEGTVAVEGGKEVPDYMQVSVIRASASVEESVSDNLHGVLASGGKFKIEGLPPGKYFIHANPFSGDSGLYLKSVIWNGRDVIREPIDVSDGASVEGVRLVYASDPAKLEVALVKASDGKAATNVNVFLIPADLARWNLLSPQHFCSTGGGGSCEINAPPGEYLVVLLPGRVNTVLIEAEIRRRAAGARRVSLRTGETQKFESTVAER